MNGAMLHIFLALREYHGLIHSVCFNHAENVLRQCITNDISSATTWHLQSTDKFTDNKLMSVYSEVDT